MSRAKPREITVAEIAANFDVASASYWWGDRWSPAVYRKDDGSGYGIRFVKSQRAYGSDVSVTFDYFELDNEGGITIAPRGHARDYKPGRVVDIAAGVDRYAAPDPTATRIGLR